MLKYVLPCVLVLSSACVKPETKNTPSPSVSAMPVAAPTATPVPHVSAVPVPPVVLEDEETPPVESKIPPVPSNWREVDAPMWHGFLPPRVDLRNDLFEYMAQVMVGDGRSFMFSFDCVKGKYSSLEDVTKSMTNVLTSSRVIIHTSSTLNINNQEFQFLETESMAGDDNLGVDIYLSYKDKTAFVFSCGSDDFSTEDKLECSRMMHTVILK